MGLGRLKTLAAAFAISALPFLGRAQEHANMDASPVDTTDFQYMANFGSVVIPTHMEASADISLSDLSRISFNHANLVILGDTWHSDQNIKNAMLDTTLLISLAEAGVKNMAIEAHGSYHKAAYYAYLSDDDGFEEPPYKAGYNLVEYRGKNYPVFLRDSTSFKTSLFYKHFAAAQVSGLELRSVDAQSESYKEILTNRIKSLKDTISFKALHERITSDTLVFERLAEFTSDSTKTIMIYGAAHAASLGDLFHEDPRLSVLKINVYADMDKFLSSQYDDAKFSMNLARYNNRLITFGFQGEDMVYILDEGKVYFPAGTDQDLINDVESFLRAKREFIGPPPEGFENH